MFLSQEIANQKKKEQLIKEAEEEWKRDQDALVHFIKKEDVETCINSIYVLIDTAKPEESLRDLMTRLHVSRRDLIEYMDIMLHKNI